VYVNFLIVGHTHEDIDAMFGRWNYRLRNMVVVKTSHFHVTFFSLAPRTFLALEYRSP
jgi:hypothetical protein